MRATERPEWNGIGEKKIVDGVGEWRRVEGGGRVVRPCIGIVEMMELVKGKLGRERGRAANEGRRVCF